MSFQNKYLKYKNKYLDLKKQVGGSANAEEEYKTIFHFIRHAESCSNLEKISDASNASNASSVYDDVNDDAVPVTGGGGGYLSNAANTVKLVADNVAQKAVDAATASRRMSPQVVDRVISLANNTRDVLHLAADAVTSGEAFYKTKVDPHVKSAVATAHSAIQKGTTFVVDQTKELVAVARQKTSHPPLSEYGMYQASLLSDRLEEYHTYYCSPSARTILTALISLESKYRDGARDRKEVVIVPHLIEFENVAGYFDMDYQNKPLSENSTKLIVGWFKQFLNSNFLQYFPMCDSKLVKLQEDLHDLILRIKRAYEFKKSQDGQEQIDELSSFMGKLLVENLEEGERRIAILRTIEERLMFFSDNIFNTDDNFNLESGQREERETLLNRIRDDIVPCYRCALYYRNNDRFGFVTFAFRLPDIQFKSRENQDNLELFIDQVTRSNPRQKRICCFTHGSLLHKFFGLKKKMHNTQILQCESTTSKIKKQVLPYHVQETLDKFKRIKHGQRLDRICSSFDERKSLFTAVDEIARSGTDNTLTKESVNRLFHLDGSNDTNSFQELPPIYRRAVNIPRVNYDVDEPDEFTVYEDFFKKYLKYNK